MFYPWWLKIGLFLLPIIHTYLNIKVNKLLQLNTSNDIYYFIVIKIMYDYITTIGHSQIIYYTARQMTIKFKQRLDLGKIHYGVPISGNMQRQFKDLKDDISKLRDFLFVIPLIWTSLISFGISIINMNINYLLRIILSIFCIILFLVMTYLTDNKLYEMTKPLPNIITNLSDSKLVIMKLSMNYNLQLDFDSIKSNKQQNQYKIQKYFICIINLVITLISLKSKNFAQIYSFGNITWMMGSLSDNIKSLLYNDYMAQFLSLCVYFETNNYKSENEIPITDLTIVRFIDCSFKYIQSDENCIITNLSFDFIIGNIYYLEGNNGIGKSTIFKMFVSNLTSGSIYIGNTNRKNISFNDLHSAIFYAPQASEFTPSFSKDEFETFKGKDLWLEEQLGITSLFGKDTIEMSGGQKKRMFIYIILISNCRILLLDEILSELSTEDIPEVVEGGGWLSRVINTIVNWEGRKNKLIILVGHGLLNIIPNMVIKLKIMNDSNQTTLQIR